MSSSRFHSWVLVSAIACSVACKGTPEARPETGLQNRKDEPLLDGNAEAHAATGATTTSDPPSAVPAPPPPPPTSPPGTIAQSELFGVLDLSPGVFLSHVDAEPRLVGGRFAGWQIRRFFPGDARFANAPIKPGDVVLRVNGSTLERPDQLAALWKKLRAASALEVEVSRGGTVTVWRWPIVLAPGATPAEPN